MARFYTHLDNHNGLERDSKGKEFDGLDQAIRQAAQSAGAVLTEDLASGRSPVSIRLLVDDATGTRQASIIVEARIEHTSAG